MKAIYKVPNGKLIKIHADIKNNKIQNIKITGDFFCHPEEKFSEIEKSLLYVPFEEEIIKNKIKQIIQQQNLTLIGLSPDDLTKTIMMLT
ncbi:biotin--protein ligase [Candidatus Woesearchaeota archaeon]|nr:biotin--protein ligase [Candidatus Woesearchaeota archaeon]